MLIEFSDIELAVFGMACAAAGATAAEPGRVMPDEMATTMTVHHDVLYSLCQRVTALAAERGAFILAQRDLVAQADAMRGKPN